MGLLPVDVDSVVLGCGFVCMLGVVPMELVLDIYLQVVAHK